jgi:hypothetical protein
LRSLDINPSDGEEDEVSNLTAPSGARGDTSKYQKLDQAPTGESPAPVDRESLHPKMQALLKAEEDQGSV